MKYLLTSVLFFGLFFISKAQKADPPLTENDWFLHTLSSDPDPSDILYLSTTEAVAPVSIGKKDFGIVKVNDKGKELWKVLLPGRVRAMGKTKKGVLVLVESNKSKNLTIQSYLLDGSNGKTISEATIYEDSGEKAHQFKSGNVSSGVLNHLFIRKTNQTDKSPYWNREILKTRECKLVSFDSNGTKTNTASLTIPAESFFLNSVTNNQGDLFTCYFLDDQLVIEKFDLSGKPVQKLQTAFPVKKIWNLSSILYPDPINGQQIWFTATYENNGKDETHQTFGFDFGAKKIVSSGEEELDKNFRSTIEMTEIKGAKKANLKMVVNLKPAGFVSLKDKIIVLEQAEYTEAHGTNGATRYATNGLYVSFYDRNLKKLKTICLSKWYEAFIGRGLSLGYRAIGDKLYFATPALASRLASYNNIFGVINPDSMSFEKVLSLDNGHLSSDKAIEGYATFWFSKSALVSYMVGKDGFFSAPENKQAFQRISWE